MTYATGTKLKFEVEGQVTADGLVAIGCKTFRQGEIGEVARNLIVEQPPKPRRPELALGQVWRRKVSDEDYYVVANGGYGAELAMWSLRRGTYVDNGFNRDPLEYWDRQDDGELVLVFDPAKGEYLDSCSARSRY